MKLIRLASFLLIFTLVKTRPAFGQVRTCYIKQMGLKTMTKEEFLKADSIETDNNDYLVSFYTAVVESTQNGKPVVNFQQLHGVTIAKIVKEWVASYDTCRVTFDEIKVCRKSDYPFEGISVNATFSISIK